MYVAPQCVWSIVTDNGTGFVSYITFCALFLSDTKVNIYMDVELRDNFGATGVQAHTKAINIDSIKAALSINSLTFDPKQTEVNVILGENVLNNTDISTESKLKYTNHYCGPSQMSGLRLTVDGRITRLYYSDSNEIAYGNLYVCGSDVKPIMWQGNILRIHIYGATYS